MIRQRRERWPKHLRELARTEGMITPDEADLLYRAARDVRSGVIVEVGAYRGRSATALALGADSGHGAAVFSVDPHEPFRGALGGTFGPEDRGAFYRTMLSTRAYRSVRLLNCSSAVIAAGWNQPVGLLWLDADHTYDGVAADYACWSRHLLPGATILFDDATDPALGPYRLIAELVSAGTIVEAPGVGKIRAARLA